MSIDEAVLDEETLLYDHGSERALLACIMADHGLLQKCRHKVEPKDFRNPRNRVIFETMLFLHDREVKNGRQPKFDPSSMLSVAKALGKEDSFREKVGGMDYLTSVKLASINLSSSEMYADAVKHASVKVEMHREGRRLQLMSIASKGESTAELLGKMEREVSYLTKMRDSHGIIRLGDIMDTFLDDCERNRKEGKQGVKVRFMPRLMKILNDLRRKQFIILFARPKTGKSAFMMNVAEDVACEQNTPVLYIDTEMDADEQLSRALAKASQVEEWDIISGRYKNHDASFDAVNKKVARMRQAPFHYFAARGATIHEIIDRCHEFVDRIVGRNQHGRTNPCLILYDWLKVMNEDELSTNKEHQRLGFIATALNDAIKVLDVPLIAGAQANRQGGSKNATASSAEEAQMFLADSDRILRFCTCLIWLRRLRTEELAEQGDIDVDKRYNQMIHVLDQRRGPSCMEGIPLSYDGSKLTYAEMEEKAKDLMPGIEVPSEDEDDSRL